MRLPSAPSASQFPTDGLAVDWVTDMLYWSDAMMKRIEAYNIVTGERNNLLTAHMALPGGIAVDPWAG